MVYAAWKVLRLPFYVTKTWTQTRDGIFLPFCIGAMCVEIGLLWKYTTLSEAQEKECYVHYPEATDPITERNKKYYTMFLKQQGIDITDPAFTGMERAQLEAQINSA
eukprot:TRINITY_DN1133_c0_g2_i1.p2 TRINITY_DN1133_c0_g2~~TRINITY_DN1133_c0_g2_i1.p2  ORF type:complete len:107 (+),score=59.52 TRINITY_DN1133_c0_g2_i1:54-374(+)